MHIGSGLNTVSSMYRQQKGNNMKAPASAEKTFYTAETPKVYQIFTTDNMLWTGGNGTGLSYCLKAVMTLAAEHGISINAESRGYEPALISYE